MTVIQEWPNNSPEPTPIGACSLRSQRRHELVARQETFASRIVVAVAVRVTSRRWPAFYVRRLDTFMKTRQIVKLFALLGALITSSISASADVHLGSGSTGLGNTTFGGSVGVTVGEQFQPPAQHEYEAYQSGIIGLVDGPCPWNVAAVSDDKNTIVVPIEIEDRDRDGFFEVDLKPGNYILTVDYIPYVGPGQPTPNIVGIPVTVATVTVTKHHFTVVEIPVPRLLPPAPIGYQPFRISGGK